MSAKQKGPIYGVELLDVLPLDRDNPDGMLQAMPSAETLRNPGNCDIPRIVSSFEVLTAHYHALKAENETLKARLADVEKPDCHDDTETCRRCRKHYYLMVWATSDETWEAVTGINDGSGLFCPTCFSEIAMQKGIHLRWVATPNDWPESFTGIGRVPNQPTPNGLDNGQ